MFSLLTGCWLGFLIGLRHALDADHLAAISTLVIEQPRPRRAALLGAFWGLGHSASLIAAGAVLLALRIQLAGPWAERFELAVAVMLIALGARSIRLSLRSSGGEVAHAHGPLFHRHAAAEEHFHLRSATIARRPFLIGVVHGLAGTGGITALAMASMPGPAAALAYVAVFAIGSIAGMSLLTGLAGFPIGRLAQRPRTHKVLIGGVGTLSVVVGLIWGARVLYG